MWVVNWVLHALVTQPLHLFEANIFYPAPHALARSEHIVATALLPPAHAQERGTTIAQRGGGRRGGGSAAADVSLGRVLTQGTPDQVRSNPEVQKVYLGQLEEASA